ncbi:MAG: sugar transferase [Acidimicrobiales bacterium]|nr:sugar transferase [Acidimicrobiales bacterium]
MSTYETSAAGNGESFVSSPDVVLGGDPFVLHQPGKRAFDVGVGLLLLVLLSPVLVVISLAVKLTSRGPVLFTHERIGRGGQPFHMYKFRSMRHDAEEMLQADPVLWEQYRANDFKLPAENDPRVTRVGRILRKTSLDELPQLLNVLFGHMSLVGPRPVILTELDECYGQYRAAYCSVRPGMTGLWQTSGRSSVAFPERAELDARYVDEMSPGLDLRILFRTLIEVVRRTGAH